MTPATPARVREDVLAEFEATARHFAEALGILPKPYPDAKQAAEWYKELEAALTAIMDVDEARGERLDEELANVMLGADLATLKLPGQK